MPDRVGGITPVEIRYGGGSAPDILRRAAAAAVFSPTLIPPGGLAIYTCPYSA